MDPKLSEIIDDLKKHEGMPTVEQMEELEEMEGGKDKCWLAMKAAWDTLAEYCGGAGVPIDVEGMSFTVPIDVIETARTHPDMSRDERIDMVAETDWCKKTADDMCENLFGYQIGTTEHFDCIEKVANRLAVKIVD